VTEGLILFACWWAPVYLLAAVLRTKTRRPVFWGWLILATLVHAAYTAATHLTLPPEARVLPPEADWLSRLAGIAVGVGLIVLMLRRHRLLMPRELGLTVKPAPGSLPWTLGGIVLLVALGVVADGFAPLGAETPSLPAVAYHLTLPGLAEEPLYRGLLLALLAAAMGKRPAAIFWAAVMTNLIFALDHGLFWHEGRIGFNLVTFATTGLAGTILTAIRLRSGSLLPAVIGHNLMGLAARFA
jgi:membrane protease YdiL (CAAX protease family)